MLSRLTITRAPLRVKYLRCVVPQTRTLSVDTDQSKSLFYEGPFAQLSIRLKRISLCTAGVGVFGVPILIAFHSGDIPAVGQLAVGGTAILGATGSTMALSFCFSPYIHTLEKIPVPRSDNEKGEKENDEPIHVEQDFLLKATTRNLFAMKVETIINPATDITEYTGMRPFCNFYANGKPFFVHPELIPDEKLRTQLLGDVDITPKKPLHDDDDGFP